MTLTRLAPACAIALVAASTAAATDERVDSDMNWKIRQEARDHSQIMRTMHYLTDVYGPRLTGSPNLRAAGEWAARQMTEWGLDNAHLEPWEFGRTGWLNERLAVHVTSPVRDALVAEVLAWTPGTNGPVTAEAVRLEPPERPARESLTAYLASMKDKVKGRMALVGAPQRVLVSFNPPARRREDQDVRNQYDPDNPSAGQPPAFAQTPSNPPARQGGPEPLTGQQISRAIDGFLLASGAAARINDAGRDHGQIRAFQNRTYDPAQVVPTLVMRNEDYGRVWRLLADGPVTLDIDIVNRLYPEGRTAHNVIAEIPGSDKRDEVVMLGGHLDSWHAATGATDNAIGCAVMMEAARILKAIGVAPRRTIRVALWGGEEQGLLGSQAYVREHFGSAEEPKPGFFKFAGYFNIDSGTGRARGATVFGPPDAAAVLRAALAPFEDLGVAGATFTRSRRRGGSDHTSFNEAGLPGIGMGQDPIEYGTYTWHTNLDTYERIVPADAQSSATVIAAAVYHLAMREEMLPRFSKEQMPPRPKSQP